MQIASKTGIGDISTIINSNKTKKHFIRGEKIAGFMGVSQCMINVIR